MFDLIRELSLLDGTSGREDRVREYIIEKIRPLGDEASFTVDALGNLTVFRKGKRPAENKVMFDAHMDEVGVIATFIEDNGLIRFTTVGGISAAVMLGRLFKFESGVTGVSGVKPIHLLEKEEESVLPDEDAYYIDIGCRSREDALKYVTPGDTAVFVSEYRELGGGRIKGKALDDRIGCAVMLDMILGGIPYDACFNFSVQEEIGLRGAGAAAYAVRPDYAIVLESTTAADLPDTPEHKRVCELGRGAAVSFMDNRTIYNRDLFKVVFSIANDNKIPIQTKTMVAGGNNAGSIHTAGSGVKVITLNVPCRYIHSPSCVCDSGDVSAVRQLAEKCLERFACCAPTDVPAAD